MMYDAILKGNRDWKSKHYASKLEIKNMENEMKICWFVIEQNLILKHYSNCYRIKHYKTDAVRMEIANA